MKFGFRVPSLRKRISSRLSIKRYARHNLGIKAPRGFGWFTNPKKALYNRIYRRTTFGIEDLGRIKSRSRSYNKRGVSKSGSDSMGCGCLLIILITSILVSVLGMLGEKLKNTENAFLYIILIIIAFIIFIFVLQVLYKMHIESSREKRLFTKYGDAAIVERIINKMIWEGQTEQQLLESLGNPVDIAKKELKTKNVQTWKYYQTGSNRFALKIKVENGIVTTWDMKD